MFNYGPVKSVISFHILVVAVVLFVLTGCSGRQVKESIKEHGFIIRPGQTILPRPVEEGDGTVDVQDTFSPEGDSFMLIFRGRL